MLPFVLLSSAVWGVCVAAFIQFTVLGRFIALHMTWLAVALGIGGDLLLLLLLMDSNNRVAWWQIVAVIGMSSIAVSAQDILKLVAYFKGLMDAAKNPPPQ